MKQVQVELGRLIRETKKVTVEVPDDFDSWPQHRKDQMMHGVYMHDNGEDFQIDEDFGVEEESHYLVPTFQSDGTVAEFSVVKGTTKAFSFGSFVGLVEKPE